MNGLGTRKTNYVECLQSYALSAATKFHLETVDDIEKYHNASNCFVYPHVSVRECIENLNSDWHKSIINTSNKLRDYLNLNDEFEFHRNSNDVKSLNSIYHNVKKNNGISMNINKWNPSDIWIKRKGINIKTNLNTIYDLNNYIHDLFKSNNLIGVSLKKSVGAIPIIDVMTNDRKDDIKFNKLTYGKSLLSSKDSVIHILNNDIPKRIQLRTFSNKHITVPDWQGILQGKSFHSGKIGGCVLIDIINKYLDNNIMYPIEYASTIIQKQKSIVYGFVDMYSELTKDNSNDVYNQLQDTLKTSEHDAWWLSKYLSVNYVHKLHNLSIEYRNDIVKDIYNYANSTTKISSIYLKCY